MNHNFKVCLLAKLFNNHQCKSDDSTNIESCCWFEPVKFKVPQFTECSFTPETFNELVNLVFTQPEHTDPNSNWANKVLEHSKIYGRAERINSLKSKEKRINNAAYHICLIYPELLFYPHERSKLARQVLMNYNYMNLTLYNKVNIFSNIKLCSSRVRITCVMNHQCSLRMRKFIFSRKKYRLKRFVMIILIHV